MEPIKINTPEVNMGRGKVNGGRGTLAHSTNIVRAEEIMNYLIAGHNTKEIALVTGYGQASIIKIINQTEFLDKLKTVSAEAFGHVREELKQKLVTHRARIDELSMKALDTLEHLMESEREGIAYKAAADVLDRNPETPRNHHVEANTNIRVFDPAALMHAANVAEQLANLRANLEPEPPTLNGGSGSGQSGTIEDHPTGG